MENLYLLILSVLLTVVIGTIGYFLRSVHKEVKLLIKELTDYTVKLKELIIGIQTQIDKAIETDIQELKEDVKILYKKTNANQNSIDKPTKL